MLSEKSEDISPEGHVLRETAHLMKLVLRRNCMGIDKFSKPLIKTPKDEAEEERKLAAEEVTTNLGTAEDIF